MAASLLCAPVVYPWYLLWLLPFVRSESTLPLIIWTVSIIPTYIVWHLRTLGRPWVLPGWVMWLEYGSVAMTAAIILLRRIIRPAATRAQPSRRLKGFRPGAALRARLERSRRAPLYPYSSSYPEAPARHPTSVVEFTKENLHDTFCAVIQRYVFCRSLG